MANPEKTQKARALQAEKNRLGKQESKQRHLMIEAHEAQIVKMMKESGIVDPIGMILDITGTYGRQSQKAWNVKNGMTEAEAEKKIDEMITYYEGEGKFPTMLAVWSWSDAEQLMPLTSPTAKETLKTLKYHIESGQAALIVIGRHGNSYAIAELGV